MIRPSLAVFAVTLALLGNVGRARAQFYDPGGYDGAAASPNIAGFTVVGKATVAAKPEFAEIDLEVSAASELTADAIVKYRDAKRRLKDAFSALKLGNITVEERGLLVDQKGMQQNPYYFEPQQNTRAKTEVQLTRKLVVKATDIRKLDEEGVLQLVGRLLDVAQDAGAKVGPQHNNNYYYYRYYDQPQSGLVRFVLEEFDKFQEEAYEKAIAYARSRAERLARLSGVELGPVLAVREISVPSDRAMQQQQDEIPRKRLETSRFQEIPVRVELLVRFDIRSKPGGGNAKGSTP
jgi:uncharacterized protein YggE